MDQRTGDATLFNVAGSTTAVESRARYVLTLNGPPSLPPLGDLTDAVHPTCKPPNWDSRINYDILLPGLQLVNKLLSTPTSLSFFHTILFGKRQRESYILYPLAQGKSHFEFTDHPTSLRPYQERKVEAQLIKFADRVNFVVVNEVTNPKLMWAMSTHPDKEEKNFQIHVEQAAINELEAAAAEHANTGAKERYRLASFCLARTICHELAHVVDMYTYSANEFCYFPGSSIGEPGYEWERQVFSGLIEHEVKPAVLDPSEYYDAYIEPWANPRAIAAMLHDDQDIGIRLKHSMEFLPRFTDDGESVTANPVVAGSIDSPCFEKLFSESFWTKDLVEQGPSGLYPEVQACFPFKVRPKVIEILRTLYSKVMPSLEEESTKCRTEQEFEELVRLCEPWQEFMRHSDLTP